MQELVEKNLFSMMAALKLVFTDLLPWTVSLQICMRLRFKAPFSWVSRDHSGYGLCQWEKALHSNASSHWPSPYPEWSLHWVVRSSAWLLVRVYNSIDCRGGLMYEDSLTGRKGRARSHWPKKGLKSAKSVASQSPKSPKMVQFFKICLPVM